MAKTEEKTEKKYGVFVCNGLPEKDLMATAVVASIKQEHSELNMVVVTNFPEIWLHNPDVYRVYRVGAAPYFYDDFVKEKGSKIYMHDPYTTDDFIHKRKHLIEIWCDLCEVPYKGAKPSLHFTQREIEVTQKMTVWSKPLFFMHIAGQPPAQPNILSWVRAIPQPIAIRIAEAMKARGFEPIHIKIPGEPDLPGINTLNLDFRKALCAIQFSQTRLFVDSWAQQVAAALNVPSTVLWIATSPTTSGYDIHKNIVITPPKNISSIVDGYCPTLDINATYARRMIDTGAWFNIEEIIDSLVSNKRK